MNLTSKLSSSANVSPSSRQGPNGRNLLQYIRDDPADDDEAGHSPRFGIKNENSLNKYADDSIEDLFQKTNSKITTNKEDNSMIQLDDDSLNISPHINK